MNTAISAFLEMLKQLFSYGQTRTEKCLEVNTIKDKKDLKKACNVAEKLILITDCYVDNFNKKDKKNYKNLKTRFFKYN